MANAILVTGGAGFIGSNFVLEWLRSAGADTVVNVDRLTYAGNLENLAELAGNERHRFVHGSINDAALLADVFSRHHPRAVVHFAAESHVDRSIFGPEEFVLTNINGTFQLLQSAREYWSQLPAEEQARFRLLHVSTDEVYGSLGASDAASSEGAPYAPNSPYAASKAAADHLVRAFHRTYGLPTLITNCSNNYGPFQFPEKLIPLTICQALQGKSLPVYGDGLNIRDWLYVLDHCDALRRVLAAGIPGETYNIGGCSEKTNIEVVQAVCDLLQELRPQAAAGHYRSLITYVADRAGHDRRYGIDAGKIDRELGWRPRESFASGLRKAVQWYLEHPGWLENVTSGAYQQWIDKNYATRGA